MNYEAVIGLEVHVHPKTKSKMFCDCATDYFGKAPNTHTCPVCLGLPGALPVPNEKAIEQCIKLALALNCKINMETKFDRKNYFYPDLPKGYQISQYDKPIGYDGYIEITTKSGATKKVRITRIHQEEDTGKSVHEGGVTLLDYNKSGMPLMEIVTEPDLSNAEEVNAFAKALKQLVRYLDVSDADMEKGQMRFELNMSIRKVGETGLPNYKVEVKNIGSISVLEKVVQSEMVRQAELLDNGETPVQETRGLVNMTGKTRSQRRKENESDYRYFPEPDIPPLVFEDPYIEQLRAALPELPVVKMKRYTEEYGIARNIAETITFEPENAQLFEQIIIGVTDNAIIKDVANWFTGDFTSLSKNVEISDEFSPAELVEIVKLVSTRKITKDSGKKVLEIAMTTGKNAAEIVKEENMTVVTDTSKITEAINNAIAANEKAVADFRSGKNPNAVMFLVGQVMKEMKGQANAVEVTEMIKKQLES